jgi:hypothetical protein
MHGTSGCSVRPHELRASHLLTELSYEQLSGFELFGFQSNYDAVVKNRRWARSNAPKRNIVPQPLLDSKLRAFARQRKSYGH